MAITFTWVRVKLANWIAPEIRVYIEASERRQKEHLLAVERIRDNFANALRSAQGTIASLYADAYPKLSDARRKTWEKELGYPEPIFAPTDSGALRHPMQEEDNP